MAMIWSNLVPGVALMAIAASAVTRPSRPRISATMIWLPSPFILRNGTPLTLCLARIGRIGPYMADAAENCQWRAIAAAMPGLGRDDLTPVKTYNYSYLVRV